jgi:hypothetical protein
MGLTSRRSLIQSIPSNFRGLVWEPVCEQEVVMLFARLLQSDQLGMPLCVEHARTVFPDCRAVDPTTGDRVNIEFEYRSNGFLVHRKEWNALRAAHPHERWLVVCWHDNLDPAQKKKFPELQIMSLRSFEAVRALVLNWFPGDLSALGAFREVFQWRASGLPREKQAIVASLQKFGETESDCDLRWPAESEFPKFIVWSKRRKVPCFVVSADGTLNVPFSKWAKIQGADKRRVIEQLNGQLQTQWFTGRENKKKGFDAAVLLRGGELLPQFLDVWRWFSDASTERLSVS